MTAATVYFPERYRSDVRVFADGETVCHGPFGKLCGWTLGRVFEPGRSTAYSDPAAFLRSVYVLNLLDQGIYTYFPTDHVRWLVSCEPFPNLRGCMHGHGGIAHVPNSLIRFCDDPSYIPGARPIHLTIDRLGEYTEEIMWGYLGGLCNKGVFQGLAPAILCRHLMSDPHCPEFAEMVVTGRVRKE